MNCLNKFLRLKILSHITALYLEKDDAGKDCTSCFIRFAKQANTSLDIKILVDWHRAQRGHRLQQNAH